MLRDLDGRKGRGFRGDESLSVDRGSRDGVGCARRRQGQRAKWKTAITTIHADPLRRLSLISIASVASSNNATPRWVIVPYFCSFSLSSVFLIARDASLPRLIVRCLVAAVVNDNSRDKTVAREVALRRRCRTALRDSLGSIFISALVISLRACCRCTHRCPWKVFLRLHQPRLRSMRYVYSQHIV